MGQNVADQSLYWESWTTVHWNIVGGLHHLVDCDRLQINNKPMLVLMGGKVPMVKFEKAADHAMKHVSVLVRPYLN